MHRIPQIVAIAPDVLGHPLGHGRGAWPTPLAEALRGQHEGVEIYQQSDPGAVAARTQGGATGAAAQASVKPPHGPIPPLPEGGGARSR